MFDEPEINPQDDTQPTQTVPAVTLGEADTNPNLIDPHGRATPGWQRLVGLLSLLAAFGFALATIALLVMPSAQPEPERNNDSVSQVEGTASPTVTLPEPTMTPETNGQVIVQPSDVPALPTLSFDARETLLLTPVSPVVASVNPFLISRNPLDPFTVIPQRERSEVIQHVIQRGDTIYDLAQIYGLQQETIAWSNDRRQIFALRVGSTLNIPPEDGVLHTAIGDSTIADIARQYRQDDPFVVIDSRANELFGFTPDMVPPSGMQIFVPGGTAEEINWAPEIQVTGGSGSGTGGTPGTVSFESGSPGSCGALAPGSATAWGRPMAAGSYTVTRGYTDWHPGIDLASSTGTPVYAANGGKVIFAGTSNWGYGVAVVISSGPFTTLYGHLSLANVSCGQIVGTGQQIGQVGSTGNSSGPHLHFEIMFNGVRSNPAATIAF